MCTIVPQNPYLPKVFHEFEFAEMRKTNGKQEESRSRDVESENYIKEAALQLNSDKNCQFGGITREFKVTKTPIHPSSSMCTFSFCGKELRPFSAVNDLTAVLYL